MKHKLNTFECVCITAYVMSKARWMCVGNYTVNVYILKALNFVGRFKTYIEIYRIVW